MRWPYLDVPTAPIDPRDIAAIGVRALCENGHAGAEYVLTGPESLTQREQISIVGSVLGRSLRIEEMTPDEARKELVSVMNWGMAPATSVSAVIEKLLSAWGAAVGLPAFVSTTFAEITGTGRAHSASGPATTKGNLYRMVFSGHKKGPDATHLAEAPCWRRATACPNASRRAWRYAA